MHVDLDREEFDAMERGSLHFYQVHWRLRVDPAKVEIGDHVRAWLKNGRHLGHHRSPIQTAYEHSTTRLTLDVLSHVLRAMPTETAPFSRLWI